MQLLQQHVNDLKGLDILDRPNCLDIITYYIIFNI